MGEPERVGNILKQMFSEGFLQGPREHERYMVKQETREIERREMIYGPRQLQFDFMRGAYDAR